MQFVYLIYALESATFARPGYVSWDYVCIPKSNGGLGFRSLAQWNMVIIGKQAWNIAMKADNL